MMEDKFDAEFKRKVKGINPEIPDIVRMRINDTLAALPEKKNWRKFGYLSAIAALFLVCFVGIRYMYPMGLDRKPTSESPQNSAMLASDQLREQNNQTQEGYPKEEGAAKDQAADSSSGNQTALKAAPTIKSVEPNNAKDTVVGNNSGTVTMALTANDGKTAVDQGIQLILKTAIYDGKEIRIEFDKNDMRGQVYASSAEQNKTADSNEKVNSILKNAQVNVVENYDVRIVVNNIPLKCTINVIETPQGDNQYSGTMIIIPDSGLPQDLDIILSFDKIGDTSGQWLLNTQISKQ